MKKIIVSIISEQSVPNMVLIKNNQDADKFINIVTAKAQKDNYIANFYEALKFSMNDILDKFIDIQVNETKPADIMKKLEEYGGLFNESKAIFINITGGTKILSIFTYRFFDMKYRDKCHFFYMDIYTSSTSFIEISKVATDDVYAEVPMTAYSLSLEEYLRSYGVEIVKEDPLTPKLGYKEAKSVMDEFATDKYNEVILRLIHLKKADNMGNDDSFDLRHYILSSKAIIKPEIRKYCDKMCIYIDLLHKKESNFPNSSNITFNYIKYLFSKFLEEYVYYMIKEEIFEKNGVQSEGCLKLGVEIAYSNEKTSYKNDQEFDVIFIINNTICYIECKRSAKSILMDTVFKQSAITAKKLGLRTSSFLVHLDDYDDVKSIKQLKEHRKKAKNYGISLITRDELYNGEFLKKIKNALKLP